MLKLTFGTDVFIFVSRMCPVWLEAQPKLSDTRCTKWIAEQLRSCNHVKHLGRTCEKRWTRVDWELFEKRAVLLMFFFSPPERFNTRESVRLFIARVAMYRIWVPWWVQEQRSVELIDVELLRDQTLFSSHSKLLHRIWYHQLKITLYQSEDLTRKNSPCMCNVWTNIPSLCKL